MKMVPKIGFALSIAFCFALAVPPTVSVARSHVKSKSKSNTASARVRTNKSPQKAPSAKVVFPTLDYLVPAPPPPPHVVTKSIPEPIATSLIRWSISQSTWLNEPYKGNCDVSLRWRFDNKVPELQTALRETGDPVAAVLLSMRDTKEPVVQKKNVAASGVNKCTPSNSVEFEQLLLRPSELGDPRAMLMLAHFWLADQALDNDDRAIGMIAQAADLGSLDAIVEVATRSTTGEGFPKSRSEAISLAEYAAVRGNFEAMRLLADIMDPGLDGVSFPSSANAYLFRAIAAGDVISMVRLGRRNKAGRGSEVNLLEAVNWFKRAADAGDVEGMVEYATMLDKGEGIAANKKLARIWFQKAAELGNGDAIRFLSVPH
jgi:hypothetical protein